MPLLPNGVDIAELLDRSDPAKMAELMHAIYGPSAATSVAWCAAIAHSEGWEHEHRFWVTVLKRLDED